MKSVRKQLGERIRWLRKVRGFTQEQLAEILDIDQKQVSCIERGVNAPAMDRLQNVADALGVHIRDLFDFGEKDGESIDDGLLELDHDKRKLAYKIFRAAIVSLKDE